MNGLNKERRKAVLGFCVVCFLFALVIAVSALSGKSPKNKMTEYYTEGIREMTFGDPAAFSELCPEFADFEKTHYAENIPKENNCAKSFGRGTMFFERIFLLYSLIYRRDGKAACAGDGLFHFQTLPQRTLG